MLALKTASALPFRRRRGIMFVDAASAVWHAVLPVSVMVVCLMRLLFVIRRRRNPHYHGWQPTEIIAVRSIVLIITGKPMTPVTWKRIDVLVLALMLLL